MDSLTIQNKNMHKKRERLHTLLSLSKKLAFGDLFRQELSECFRASTETL